jgi:hypothetical protein
MTMIQEIIKLPLVARSFNSFTAKFANGTYHIYHDFVDNHDLPTRHPNSQYLSRLIILEPVLSGTFNQEAEFAFTSWLLMIML